jgi:hypothetical protein
MNTKQLDTEIRARIDQFLVSISGLVRQAAVEAVREALGADGGAIAGVRRGPGRPRNADSARPVTMAVDGRVSRGPQAKPVRRTRRSSTDVEAVSSEVLSYVKTHPGHRLEEIGRGLATDTAGLKLPVKELLASGRLRTEGQKRGTRYFAGGGTGGAKSSRKRKTTDMEADKRGPRTSVRQLAVKPAKKAGKRPRKHAASTEMLSAVAEAAPAM